MRQNAVDLSPLKSLSTWSEAISPSKKSTPKKKDSLMKSVLNSETKKRNSTIFDSISGLNRTPRMVQRQNSGLEILCATQIAKSLTPTKVSIFNKKDLREKSTSLLSEEFFLLRAKKIGSDP